MLIKEMNKCNVCQLITEGTQAGSPVRCILKCKPPVDWRLESGKDDFFFLLPKKDYLSCYPEPSETSFLISSITIHNVIKLLCCVSSWLTLTFQSCLVDVFKFFFFLPKKRKYAEPLTMAVKLLLSLRVCSLPTGKCNHTHAFAAF